MIAAPLGPGNNVMTLWLEYEVVSPLGIQIPIKTRAVNLKRDSDC